METPRTITITIPAQEYDDGKYLGATICGGRCYLEEALDRAGYVGASVSAVGRTRIGNSYYKPKFQFGSTVLRYAFERGESVTVTFD